MASPPPRDPVANAVLAAELLAANPRAFGGIVLRGYGPARDALVDLLCEAIPLRRMPSHIDDERLLGGVDVAASLASGRTVKQQGLLDEARGKALLIPMSERLSNAIAGRLAQALDTNRDLTLVLLDDSTEPDERPPSTLLERCAFHCDLSQARELPQPPRWVSKPNDEVEPLGQEALKALGLTAAALGVASLRPLIFASKAAQTHAALNGRHIVEQEDLEVAVRLALAPRATELPPQDHLPPDPPEKDSETPPPSPEDGSVEQSNPGEGQLDDVLVEAARAAIPADLLAQLSAGKAPRNSSGAGSGQRRKSSMRGKPLGARPGLPKGGARLALIDSLRAAVPWQELRRREAQTTSSGSILMRRDDLRIRRFEEKSAQVTIFAVDASGSAAAARLAEAKGAIELMLAQAYVTRSEVALIAFRGQDAEVLLPPTRSLTRARRALSELPGGGGTPLASGLEMACEVAEAIRSRGKSPSLVVLTDGRGNIASDGSPGRKQAGEDAERAAKAIAARGFDSLLIDISARPGPEAPALAETMQARFLALPRADAAMLHKAITAVSLGKAAA